MKGRDRTIKTDEQKQLILGNLKLARFCARKVAQKIGCELEMQELEGEAFLALVIAATGFRPELGFKFSTYAVSCIYQRLWRFLDSWRGLTLAHREAIKRGSLTQVHKFSLDYPMDGATTKLSDSIPDNRDEVLVWMERMSARVQILALMKKARLTESERECLTKVYLDGRNIRAVAKERGTSYQAVGFSSKAALEKLIALANKTQ